MVSDGRTDGRTDGMDGRTDGRTHGRRQNYIPPTSSGDNKSIHGKLEMNKFMHNYLNFACATVIGDNLDTEKSAILMLNR